MSFREQINEYIRKTEIPEEILPERLGDYIKSDSSEKNEQPREEKSVDAETFIRFVQSQKLTGDEFLQVLGNSRINNSAYLEIQDNPQLTCARLIEILNDSALCSEDYEKLIVSIYKRNKLKKDALEKIEALEKPVQEISEPKTDVPDDDELRIGQEKIPSVANDDDEDEDIDEEYDEDENSEPVYEINPDSVYGRMTEKQNFYKGSAFFDDDDTYRPGINRGKTITAAVLAVLLIGGSFGIRYMNTGSFLVADNTLVKEEKAETYEDIFAAMSELSSTVESAVKSQPLYSINGETVDSPTIGSVAICGDYMLVCNENELQIIQSIGSQLKLSDIVSYTDTLLGVTVCGDYIITVSECEKTIPFSYNYIIENEDGTTQSIPTDDTMTKSYVCLRVLDSGNPSNVTSTIMQSGTLVDLIKGDSSLYIITSDSISEKAVDSVKQTYLPHILTDDEASYPEVSDILLPGNSTAKGYVVFGTLSLGSSLTTSITACAGGSGQLVIPDDETLYVMQNSEKNTALVKYSVGPDKIIFNSVTGLDGQTNTACGLNSDDGNLRVTTSSDDGMNLLILDSELNVISQMKQIGAEETAVSTCFDTINAYIVTETDSGNSVYGINTLYPDDLTTLSAVNAKINSVKLHRWSDSLSLTLTADADESGNRTGLVLTMYDISDGFKELSSVTITAETSVSGDWNRYLSSPAETDVNAIYGSEEDGIIIIPVQYFDGISEIEKYLVFTYDEANGLVESGSVVAYDLRSEIMLAAIGEGKFFAIWDKRIICADSTDCLVLNTLNF